MKYYLLNKVSGVGPDGCKLAEYAFKLLDNTGVTDDVRTYVWRTLRRAVFHEASAHRRIVYQRMHEVYKRGRP